VFLMLYCGRERPEFSMASSGVPEFVNAFRRKKFFVNSFHYTNIEGTKKGLMSTRKLQNTVFLVEFLCLFPNSRYVNEYT
jgi:hypothetical protein